MLIGYETIVKYTVPTANGNESELRTYTCKDYTDECRVIDLNAAGKVNIKDIYSSPVYSEE